MSIPEILVQYGSLEKAQLARLYYPSDPKWARMCMNEQALYHKLFFRKNIASLTPGTPSDPDLIASVWLMLILCEGHMEKVTHAPDKHPFSLRFTAEGRTYRVMPVHESVPAHVLELAHSTGDTILLLLLDGSVPEELIVPETASVIYVTYKRPDKWGKPFIKTYMDRELTREI